VQAKVSALMEAVERFSAEYRGDPMVFAGYQEVGFTRAVDPESLILPNPLPLGEQLHWTEGWDLLNEEPVMVPSNAVYHPYDTLGVTQPLFRSDATGLAAGNEPEEAILYGLLEVVEWDALSMATREKSMGRRLSAEESPEVRRLLDRYCSAGIEIHLWLIAGRTGIPTVAAAADDTETKNPALLVMGAGTHTDPEIAAINALLEVAEGRAIQISGDAADENRDSLVHRIGYDRMKRVNREWFAPAEEIELGAVPHLSTPTFDGDIAAVLREITGHADRVCLCDLTRTGIPVVRCVVPGFEVSHSDPDRVRRTR
jgi:ribosomal protein S12 methylthiotransferase accessory factor